MKIGIIGTGNIGSALAKLWTNAGHAIVLGSKHPDKVPTIDSAGKMTVAAAINFAEIILVAIPFGAWPEFARDHGAALAGKVVLDATNTNAERDGAIVDEVARLGRGTLDYVSTLLPHARLVKVFNTMEAHVLADSAGCHPRLAHPLAGDEKRAVALAAQLVRDAGYDAVIVGGGASAKVFDEGTPVWNHPTTAANLADRLGIANEPVQIAQSRP